MFRVEQVLNLPLVPRVELSPSEDTCYEHKK
nr:MAG TPA: hypothetical protein [Caudoviricetes sp.]DAI19908.1 MAG TPA: hypothetical protein [Caudoviricetes sp.]